jgi:hypothetical protein
MKKTKLLNDKLEPCNRCCSLNPEYIDEELIKCNHCGFTETEEIWQLRGWRSITKYPPTYSGTIFVYGKEIGRTIAKWNSNTQTANIEGITHWLRTPDPTKQINMG